MSGASGLGGPCLGKRGLSVLKEANKVPDALHRHLAQSCVSLDGARCIVGVRDGPG